MAHSPGNNPARISSLEITTLHISQSSQVALGLVSSVTMARNTVVIRVLIASPSDVERDRETVAKVVGRWNAAHSTSMGLMLEPIRWETHGHPATGDYPQGIINSQIVDDSDVVVGVFWSRLGTPTPVAASGTAEEIERLRARGKRVLLYFSLADLPQGHDREQFALLQKYKKTLQRDTLYWEFKTAEELDELFSGHLATVVHEIAREIKAEPQPTPMRVSNLVTLKPLSSPRFLICDDSDTWREVEKVEDCLAAAIAIFRNEPIKGVTLRAIRGLTAQITFYDARGGELQRVYHGCWLGDPFNHTELGVGDTRELIIAVDHPRATSPFAIENTRRSTVHYEQEGSRERPLARGLYDVNVRLIGGVTATGDVVDDFHFNLDLRQETPVLKLNWTR